MPYELIYRSPSEFDDGSETHEIHMPELSATLRATNDGDAIAGAKLILKGGNLTYRGVTYSRELVSLKYKEERDIPLV